MARLPQNDFVLFLVHDDGECDISDYEKNSNIAAIEPLIPVENSFTPQVEALRCLRYFVTCLSQDTQTILVRIDEHLRTLQKIHSSPISFTDSVRGIEQMADDHDQDGTLPRNRSEVLASPVYSGLVQDCSCGG
jgi:hypothetical protein